MRRFFESSPEREALIAKTVERIKQQRAAAHPTRDAPKGREDLTP